ncbi:MAG: hypothetical protein WC217_00140 [Candidatus Paceibacterota bacterium]|jgi:hypothetical protein
MATIINTPATTEGADSGAGWAVAVLILLVVIGVGAYFWLNYRAVPATGMNINVTLPQNPVTSPTPTP